MAEDLLLPDFYSGATGLSGRFSEGFFHRRSQITGHKTETVYRRYAIVDEGMMREAAEKLAALHLTDTKRRRSIVSMELPVSAKA